MIIDQAKPVLTSVDQDIGTDLIDHSGYSRTVIEDAVYCFFSKYV